MSYDTDLATFNAAVDTLIAAWETFWDNRSTGDQVVLVPVCKGDSTYNPRTEAQVAANAVAQPTSTPYRIVARKGTASHWPLAVENPGGTKMYVFHKITNSSGALT